MIRVQDDFFYYYQIAINLASGHGSTFNTLCSTNGYQPLWQMLLVLICWCSTNPSVVLGFVALMAFTSAGFVYVLCLHLFRHFGKTRSISCELLAGIMTLYSLRLFFYGMEVVLAVPLILGLCVYVCNPKLNWSSSLTWAKLGLLTGFMVLARLDSIIVACLLAIGLAASGRPDKRVRFLNLAALVSGATPAILYFAVNRIYFGTWLPISGIAKQLKVTMLPSPNAWEGLYLNTPAYLLVFLPIPIGIAIWVYQLKRMALRERVVIGSMLFFPLVFFTVLSVRSDWHIWPWYMYAQRPAISASICLILYVGFTRRLLLSQGGVVLLALTVIILTASASWRLQEGPLYTKALQIRRFAVEHPGKYGMGDQAGRVGYLLTDKNPVVQLEGLVMDKAYLTALTTTPDLNQLLNRYHVRYYVGTYNKPVGTCFAEEEPYQAGPDSPHSKGVFCNPVATVTDQDGGKDLIFDLFDVRTQPRSDKAAFR